MSYKKIFIKLLTVPQQKEIDLESESFKLYADEYKDSKEFVSEIDAEVSYRREASKNPVFGKIRNITLGLEIEGVVHIKTLSGEEGDLLLNLINTLNSPDFKKADLVMFNQGFVLPYLTTRMIANRISINNLPIQLRHINKKPWDIKQVLDYQSALNGVGWFNHSFKRVCHFTGVEVDVLNSEEQLKAVNKGDWDKIFKSEQNHIYGLMEIDACITDKSKLSKPKLHFQEIGLVVQSEDKRTVLERIYENRNISQEDEKELLTLFKKKKLLKKDRKWMSEILRGIQIGTDFISRDQSTKKQILEIEERVNNILDRHYAKK